MVYTPHYVKDPTVVGQSLTKLTIFPRHIEIDIQLTNK
jgi:hypothetical protein